MHIQYYLYSSGRADFTIVSDDEPQGLVELHLGYQVDAMQPYFLGVIERRYHDKSDNTGLWHITCRELTGAFAYPFPVSLRHPTLNTILESLSKSGIEFFAPEKEYATTRIPCFYHEGDGISALRQLGRIFGIQDYIFQQRPDGKVYVGSWHDSGWAKTKVNVPAHLFTAKNSTSATVQILPKIRPGLLLNDRYVHAVTTGDDLQEVQWSRKL